MDTLGARAIVQVAGCTAFHVANDSGKVLIMSARHCFNYEATAWCADGGIATDESSREFRTCVRVAAATTESDLVLFEFNGGAPDEALELADSSAAHDTRLQMLGYPSDRHAHSGLNLTDNCWIRSPTLGARLGQDRGFAHNCSTYGGNSGGPILIEGTRIAVGIPDSYLPGEYDNNSSWLHGGSAGILISGFVQTHRSTLEKLGVHIARIADSKKASFESSLPFLSGRYDGGPDCLSEWSATAQAIYNTNDYLTKVKIQWMRLGKQSSFQEFRCSQNECSSADGASLRIIDNKTFEYARNGSSCTLSQTYPISR